MTLRAVTRSHCSRSLLLALLLAELVPGGLSAQSIMVTQPDGVADVVAEGRDFAKWELGNAWDLGSGCPDPVWDDRFECDLYEPETKDVAGATFTPGGTWVGEAATNDPRVWLLFPGLKSVVNLANGRLAAIDSSVYRFVTAKVLFTGSAQAPPLDAAPMEFTFTQGTNFVTDTFGRSDTLQTGRVSPDSWQIVTFDLLNEAAAGLAAWDDETHWPGLRLDPTNEPGVTFEFDWIRLTAPGGAAHKATVEWTAANLPGNTFTIEALDASGTPYELASGLAAGSTTFDADFSFLPPGGYTVRVVASPSGVSGNSCAGCLVVNSAPLLHIEQPDKRGDTDADYATAVVGVPWGPFSPGQLESFSTQMESFVGGVYSAENPDQDRDPRVYLQVSTPIDTLKYRMLSYEFELSGPRDIGEGSVARFLWGSDRSALTTSDDVVIETGLNIYVIGDLDEVPLEGGMTGAWNGLPADLRWDPHEFLPTRRWDLHWVELAPYDSAAPVFDIEWTDEDPDDDASIELWADRDREPANGNELLINDTTPLAEDADGAGDVLSWNPVAEGATPGRYFLFGRISDGRNTVDRYATGPLLVACSAADFPDLDLSSGGVSGQIEELACGTIEAGPYPIDGLGDVTFIAGEAIGLDNDFSVGTGGRFTAVIDPFLTVE